MVSIRFLCSLSFLLHRFVAEAKPRENVVHANDASSGKLEERMAQLEHYKANARAKLSQMEQEDDQDHRDLMIRGWLCRSGFSTRCVCTEEQLREQILEAGPNPEEPAIIQLCGGVIEVDDPIDISRRSVFIRCQAFGFFSQCEIEGNDHIFEGSPALAFFERVIFKEGKNRETKNGGPSCGGAMFFHGGTIAISGSVFQENEAGMGGAIYATGPETIIQIEGCTFDSNYATYDWLAPTDGGKKTKGSRDRELQRDGGDDGQTPLVAPPIIPLPDPYPFGGGAVMVADGALASIVGCTFINNEAEGDGGALMLSNFSQVEIVECTFESNEAMNSGGAAAADFAFPFYANTTFSDNSAINGGALSFSFSQAQLSGCVFGLNEAETGFGDDIFIYDDFDPFTEFASTVICEPLFPADINIFCDGTDIDTILENGYNNTNTDCDIFGEEGLEGFNCPTDGP